jgi:hypothetical protein
MDTNMSWIIWMWIIGAPVVAFVAIDKMGKTK